MSSGNPSAAPNTRQLGRTDRNLLDTGLERSTVLSKSNGRRTMKRMVTLMTCTVLCMALLAITCGKTLSEEKQKAASAESLQSSFGMSHGEVKKGLAAFLLCHKKRFQIGQPIPLSYGLILVGPGLDSQSKETGKLRIRVFKPLCISDPGNYSWFEVTGPDGQEVPWHGGNVSIPWYSPSDENSTILGLGQFTGRSSRDVGQSGRFDLTRTGVYRVRWGYDPNPADGVWSSGPLMSNEVQFEIIGR
jgi:hypothetical protein